MFMTFICTDFLFTSGQMMGLERNLGTILAGCATIVVTVAVWLHMRHVLKKGELA